MSARKETRKGPGLQKTRGEAPDADVERAIRHSIPVWVHVNKDAFKPTSNAAAAPNAPAIAAPPAPVPTPSSAVDHPAHYNAHPAGVECIDVVEHLSFNVGSAIKYLWRAGLKPGEATDKNLAKAEWYVRRERARLRIAKTETAKKNAP